MNYQEILSDLKQKKYYPIYVLQGEEPYYIDLISDYIEQNILTEEEKDFNQTIVYGKDTSVEQIITMARRYPMMANYQVIIVKEAQNIQFVKRGGKSKSEDDESNEQSEESISASSSALVQYAENPLKSTILVICNKYKKIDGTSKFMKTVAKMGCVFTSDKIADWNLAQWIENYLRDEKLDFDYNIPNLLAEYLGSDLQKIANEITKLRNAVPGLKRVTADIIEKYIGISKEYNDLELVDAFAARNAEKVFRIINYYAMNPKDNPPQRTIPMLFSFFKNILILHYNLQRGDDELSKILGLNKFIIIKKYKPAMRNYPAMKTFKIISLLREYDLKTKGVNAGNATPQDLMKELAIKILV